MTLGSGEARGLGFGFWGLGVGMWDRNEKLQAVWISHFDARFQEVLGFKRFWVQDVYLPLLNEYGTHTRQSRPDFGCGFEVKVPKRFQVVPISLGNISFDLGAGVHHSF